MADDFKTAGPTENFPGEIQIKNPTSYKIDGKTMFEYDVKTVTLRVAEGFIEPSILEVVTRELERSPEGINMEMPLHLHPPAHFTGLKKVEYLT